MNNLLVVIPARGGSRGLPGKNIRELCGRPLIAYSIDVARTVTSDENICVSTDDRRIIDVVERYGLKVPFVRPSEYATDTATTNEVLLHAVSHYESSGKIYDAILLLQPTSPLRTAVQVKEAIAMYREDIDMVVSVTKSHAPSVLCSDNAEGYVELVYNKKCLGRQLLPDFYEYNGAIYVINVRTLKEKGLGGFDKRVKYVMPAESSVDIDDIYDFMLVESIMRKNNDRCLNNIP